MSSLDHRTGLRDRLRARPALYGSIAVAAIALLVVVLVVFQPQRLLYDNVVDDQFPVVESSPDDATPMDDDTSSDAASSDAASAAAASSDGTSSAAASSAAATAMDDDVGVTSTADTMDDGEAAPETGDTDTDDTVMDDTEVEAGTEPSGPVALASGGFVSRSRYTVTGDATVYELEDGSRTLRLEDFESTNGPSLFVYLSSANDDASDADLGADFIDLGALRGNVGNQNYDIPADVDLEVYDTVVIWCRPFTVAFGAANLS